MACEKTKKKSVSVQPNKSRFTGVTWHKSSGKWQAQIGHEGKKHSIGHFEDEIEAAKAWDVKARSLRGAATTTNFNLDGSACGKKKTSSHFTGVGWDKRGGKWQARIKHEGKMHHIGTFEDEVEAAKAWDVKARSLRGAATKTNFKLDGSEDRKSVV